MIKGERHSGLLMDWPDICQTCKTPVCVNADNDKELRVCHRGLCYKRIDKDIVAGGFIHKDMDRSQKRIKKAFRKYSATQLVNLEYLDKAIKNINGYTNEIAKKEKAAITKKIIANQARVHKSADVAREIGVAFNTWLQDTHDWRQLLSAVTQNFNVALAERYETRDEDKFLEMATRNEKAVFYGCKLIQAKIDLISIVYNLERNNYRVDECANIEPHKLVVKMVRIYDEKFKTRNIKISIAQARVAIRAHHRLVSILPHAILDNALKYTPENSKVIISFRELDNCVEIEFASPGPRIIDEEKETIFLVGKRGREAKKVSPDGIGFGLYAARKIAEKLAGDIRVEQDDAENRNHPGYYDTRFIIALPKKI